MSVWVVYVIIKTGGFELFLLDFDEIMSICGIMILDYKLAYSNCIVDIEKCMNYYRGHRNDNRQIN